MRHKHSAPSLSATDTERIKEVIHDLTGIHIPDLRQRDFERAVYEGMQAASLTRVSELEAHLRDSSTSSRVLEPMLPALTVGETHFFRNRDQIFALEQQILPELLEVHKSDRQLRIWSAGCSSGEEPFTLAILLDKLISDIASWDLQIFGTDINPGALHRAAIGQYGTWSFRDVPETIQQKYFQRVGDRFELDPDIRRRVNFFRLNLVEDDYPSLRNGLTDLDLILCRNVLIYFRPETVHKVIARLHRALVPAGWLVVGHVEPTQDAFTNFETVNFPGTVFYRKPLAEPHQHVVIGANATNHVLGSSTERRNRSTRPRYDERKPLRKRTSVGHKNATKYATPKTKAKVSEFSYKNESSDNKIAAIERLVRRQAAAGNLEEADRLLDDALKHAELSAPLHLLHGLILGERGKDSAAVEALRKAVFLEPRSAVSHYSLAIALVRLDKIDRATKALANAASLIAGQPTENAVPYGEGLTYGRLGELVQARLSQLAQPLDNSPL